MDYARSVASLRVLMERRATRSSKLNIGPAVAAIGFKPWLELVDLFTTTN
jgi:hypothetical protein